MSARLMTAGWVWGVVLVLVAPAAQATPETSTPPQVVRESDQTVIIVARKKKKKRNKPRARDVSPSAQDNNDSGAIMSTRRGPARVDFDDRLIQGQTNKSGAIYIFDRKSSDLHSMVRRRTSFRDEILKSLD